MKKNTPAPNSVVSTFTSQPSQSPSRWRWTRSRAVALPRAVRGAGVGVELGAPAHPGEHAVVGRSDTRRSRLGVMQVEGGTLGADPRQGQEVVARRRARRGPLQRCAVAPRVVDLDLG